MHSTSPYYELDTECWNCGKGFGEHRTVDDCCPKPKIDGKWNGFFRTMRFLNREATPIFR